MSKYIKQQKVELALGSMSMYKGRIFVEDALAKIADLPTIDIVRCKDCKYSEVYLIDSNEEPQRWCKIGLAKVVNDDDYCSWGE